MIILNQHGVIEAKTMIQPAAATHGIFLNGAQPRRCLACAHNMSPRVGYRVRNAARGRRDAGKMAQEIQGDALGGQNAAGRSGYFGNNGAGSDRGAVVQLGYETDIGFDQPERGGRELEACDRAGYTRSEYAASLRVGRDTRLGCNVAGAA
jgi:hypothetical protein